jgi:hypothetical protein
MNLHVAAEHIPTRSLAEHKENDETRNTGNLTWRRSGMHIGICWESQGKRRILGPKRDEVTREWRKLHNEEFRDLYSSPSIIRIIKSRRMR